MKERISIAEYLKLTKPTIMLLVLLTGSASLVIQGSVTKLPGLAGPGTFLLILLGLFLTGGSANAFNMYLEWQIDSKMERTKRKRPIPLGKIRPKNALIFAITIGLMGVSIFTIFFDILSAVLSLGTILFYSFFYTLYLKPRTPYNIVIGGIAGAMAPVIAWAATAGQIALAPLILFLIIFLWTPPHFWALAIHLKNDYEQAGLPMMPNVRGIKETKKRILAYVVILILSSILAVKAGAGVLYIVSAAVLGLLFLRKAIIFLNSQAGERAWGLFKYSIVYLLCLFSSLIIDAILGQSLI